MQVPPVGEEKIRQLIEAVDYHAGHRLPRHYETYVPSGPEIETMRAVGIVLDGRRPLGEAWLEYQRMIGNP